MSKSVALLLVLVLTASAIITFLPVEAESRTIVVPDDYSTISAAVSNAGEGATIYLKRGTYEIQENQLRISKTLSIIGEGQANTVVVFPPDTRTGYGLLVEKIGFRVSADNFRISDLTITNCDVGVSVTGNGAQVSHVTTSGLYLRGSYCRASENNLSIASSRPNTIDVSGSFNTVENNSFPNDSGNIGCSGSFNIVVGNADVVNGIEVSGYSHFIANNHGMHVSLSNSNVSTVYKNSVSSISLRDCYNNTVCGNIIKGPMPWGILMASGSGNVIHGNNITNFNGVFVANGNPYGYGVAIGSYNSVAEKNLFYHNNLVGNYKDVSANWPVLGSGNYWDDGVEGNYWDSYSGVDSDSDGIADVEYTISGREWDDNRDVYVTKVFGKDHYPLMVPFDVSSVTVELPEWAYPPSLHVISPENLTYPFSANVTLNFTINKQASWLRYSLDGQDNVTIAGNTTLLGLSSGLHNVTVYADDPFGYRVSSEIVYFTIAEPEPEPETFPVVPVVTASAGSIVMVGVTLLVYFKKHKKEPSI
jgi:parallel beta-helix repeat protein